jgi:hypothetical protein
MKLAREPVFLDFISIIARSRKNGKRQQSQKVTKRRLAVWFQSKAAAEWTAGRADRADAPNGAESQDRSAAEIM